MTEKTADTQRLEMFLESVDGRSRRSLRKALEAEIGGVRRHAFVEELVDGGGRFEEHTSARLVRGTTRITFHGPVLHRADGAVWAPDEAGSAGQRYARWLVDRRIALPEVIRA